MFIPDFYEDGVMLAGVVNQHQVRPEVPIILFHQAFLIVVFQVNALGAFLSAEISPFCSAEEAFVVIFALPGDSHLYFERLVSFPFSFRRRSAVSWMYLSIEHREPLS